MNIQAYGSHSEYLSLQQRRPDYNEAVRMLNGLTLTYSVGRNKIRVADFCCGVGNHSMTISQLFRPKILSQVTLIDNNQGFLNSIDTRAINARNIEMICADAATIVTPTKHDIALSLFAYHHIPNDKKEAYLQNIRKSIRSLGIILVGEIYSPSQEATYAYYKGLLDAIEPEKRTNALKTFIRQTAESTDVEFKVSKEYADRQFANAGLKLLFDQKVWPSSVIMDDPTIGMYMQVLAPMQRR